MHVRGGAATEPTAALPRLSLADRHAQERRSRRLIEADLLDGSTLWRGGPYEAHVQFSNYCNLSCIMCWDGENPPLKRIDPRVLARLDEQVAPWLSVVTPHDGSEPLALTWELTRDLAIRWQWGLSLVTNLSLLDERRLREAIPITETLFLSIDSHVPEVFEHLRPGASAERIFANARAAASASREAGLECFVNLVLMVENAPMLPQTIEWLHDIGIDSVNVIQMLDMNQKSSIHDPLVHLSADFVTSVRETSMATAERLEMRLVWLVGPTRTVDARLRRRPTGPRAVARARAHAASRWSERLRLRHPGYCPKVFDRLRISAEGAVGPCCYAVNGELDFGQLATDDFDAIWNSPSAQDLRRGMATDDVPVLCASCRWHDLPATKPDLPFTRAIAAEFGLESATPAVVLDPDHCERRTDAPVFSLRAPDAAQRRWHLALSLGGEATEVHRFDVVPEQGPEARMDFRLPDDAWEGLRHNVGYWWAVWGVDPLGGVVRSDVLRCVIRHRPIARIHGSHLAYPGTGARPTVDLGGTKEHGFLDRDEVQHRPVVAGSPPPPPPPPPSPPPPSPPPPPPPPPPRPPAGRRIGFDARRRLKNTFPGRPRLG